MGSFDYTCALSEFPIPTGSKVKVIPLVESKLGLNGGAYSQMAVVFPFIRGDYNEYGFVDNILSTTWTDNKMAEYYGYADTENLAFELCNRDFYIDGNPIKFSIVLESVWNTILEMPVSNIHLLDDACKEGAKFFINSVSSMRNHEIVSKLSDNESIATVISYLMNSESKIQKYPKFRDIFEYGLYSTNSVYRYCNVFELLVFWY